jgi:hypothetical protein
MESGQIFLRCCGQYTVASENIDWDESATKSGEEKS